MLQLHNFFRSGTSHRLRIALNLTLPAAERGAGLRAQVDLFLPTGIHDQDAADAVAQMLRLP